MNISKHLENLYCNQTYQSIKQSGFSMGSRYEHEPENRTTQNTIRPYKELLHDTVE